MQHLLFGKTEVVEALLKAGADINKGNNIGETPLYAASYNGHTEVVKVLLNVEGIDHDKNPVGERTPYAIAAKNGHIGVVCLFRRYLKLNIQDTACEDEDDDDDNSISRTINKISPTIINKTTKIKPIKRRTNYNNLFLTLRNL